MPSSCSILIQILKFHFWLVDNHQSFLPNSFLYRTSQIFVDIFAKNMNGWSDKSKILCIEQSGRAEKNTRKQKFYPSSRSQCKYFPNIFLSPGYPMIFAAVFPRFCSTGPLTLSHPSASLSKFKLILVLLRWGFNSYQIFERK